MNYIEVLDYLSTIKMSSNSYNIAVGFVMSRKTYEKKRLFSTVEEETKFLIESDYIGKGFIIRVAHNRFDSTIIDY